MTDTQQYGSLREKIAAEKAERLERYANFERVYDLAEQAGLRAGDECIPPVMIVQQHANPLDDSSPVIRQYEPVTEGPCGFAWVTVNPANSSFAIWAKKNHGWKPAYGGGVQYWVGIFGQSMARKEAFARAFAAVLRDELGVRAYAGSRMD